MTRKVDRRVNVQERRILKYNLESISDGYDWSSPEDEEWEGTEAPTHEIAIWCAWYSVLR